MTQKIEDYIREYLAKQPKPREAFTTEEAARFLAEIEASPRKGKR